MIGQDEIISSFISLLQQEGASSKTQKSYIADLKNFFLWLDSNTKTAKEMETKKVMKSIEKNVIEAYLSSLLADNKSIATVNRHLSTLRIFFTANYKLGISPTNPTTGISNVTTEASTDPAISQALAYWQTHLNTRGYGKEELNQRMTVIRDFLVWKKRNSKTV